MSRRQFLKTGAASVAVAMVPLIAQDQASLVAQRQTPAGQSFKGFFRREWQNLRAGAGYPLTLDKLIDRLPAVG